MRSLGWRRVDWKAVMRTLRVGTMRKRPSHRGRPINWRELCQPVAWLLGLMWNGVRGGNDPLH
jgi:hypothetical protein